MSRRSLASWLVLPLLLAPVAAEANGNVSHLRVTLWARDHLPAGELRDLLDREDTDLSLQNGANFPDGGYAVDDGYGEIAHWEPFQSAYLEWIRANFEPPWSGEAGQHVAFLMGMASHGMCDQIYDSMYLTRSGVYDEGSPGSSIGLDGSSDVCFAAETGPLYAPELWVPDEVMAQIMLDAAGHEVEPSVIHDGQALVAFSLYFVSDVSQDPDEVALHHEAYPWACAHQVDEDVPGNPPAAAPVVAAYWERLWSRLHGDDTLDEPLLASFPALDGLAPERDGESIESMVSFVVARGLHQDTVGVETIAVRDSDGKDVPVDIHLYYGHNSHVVNLRPVDGWTGGLDHTVVAGDGLLTWDGEAVGSFEFTFAGGDDDDDGDDDDSAEDPETCACSAVGARPRHGLALLGLSVVLLAVRRRIRAGHFPFLARASNEPK
jgi:hypothetical protein